MELAPVLLAVYRELAFKEAIWNLLTIKKRCYIMKVALMWENQKNSWDMES